MKDMVARATLAEAQVAELKAALEKSEASAADTIAALRADTMAAIERAAQAEKEDARQGGLVDGLMKQISDKEVTISWLKEMVSVYYSSVYCSSVQ